MSFGRYREIALLGQGGMARVSLAALPGALGTQKLVVIKEILPELAIDPDYVAMFTDEARLASKLDHPNLVQCFEVGEADGRYFIVMEYLEGQPLSAVLGRTKRQLPLPVYLHVLTRVLAGLHAAHELADLSSGTPLGVVHRDVTPQNVFLTYGGAIKLVDFGIAKAKGAAVRTETGVFKGKLAYAAPEQIANDAIDRRSDVFAVGVLLWEGLARQRISLDLAEPAILHRRINGLDPKIATIAPDAPPALAAICDRAMATDRAARYATAADMLAAIDAFIETSGMRTTDAEVGALVAQTFEQERSQVRRLIQERLAAPSDARVGVPTPLLPPPNPSSESGLHDDDDPTRSAGAGAGGRVVTSPTHASVSVELGAHGTASRRRTVLFGLLAVLVVVGGATLALRRTRIAPSPAVGEVANATPAPPPEAGATAVDVAAATVEVSVAATPAAAKLTLDGVVMDTNPFTKRLPRDGKSHTLSIAAPGYAPDERTLVLDRDVRLELALRPERATPATGRPSKPAGPSDEPRPRRPTKPIDTVDPWGASH